MNKWQIKRELPKDHPLSVHFPYGPHEGETIYLLTPKELEALPDGTIVIDINGFEYTKGKDRIDNDTRFGHLAYGILKNDETTHS